MDIKDTTNFAKTLASAINTGASADKILTKVDSQAINSIGQNSIRQILSTQGVAVGKPWSANPFKGDPKNSSNTRFGSLNSDLPENLKTTISPSGRRINMTFSGLVQEIAAFQQGGTVRNGKQAIYPHKLVGWTPEAKKEVKQKILKAYKASVLNKIRKLK